MNLNGLPPELAEILQRDGFVIFVCGPKERGKTNLTLLLLEIAYIMGWAKETATNIWTESYMVKKIDNYPDLEAWLLQGFKKIYALDEAGKHIKKMRFMSEENQKIMDIIQLIWHYSAGFIGTAPSESFIDNNFLNTDILDAKVRKITQTRAKVFDYLHNSTYFWNDIPITSIKYNRKDIAPFSMEKKTPIAELPQTAQVARYYSEGKTLAHIGTIMGLHKEEVKRLLIDHLQQSFKSQVTHNQEVSKPIESS